MSFRVEEAGQFRGQVIFLNIVLPSDCIGNAQVKSSDPIAADKLQHQHRAVYAQESATPAADEARVIHVVKGAAGTLKTFKAGSVVANIGAATVTVDLKKNGVSVLTAPISLDSGDAAYALVEGTISSAAVAAGDVLEVVIDGTAGGGTLAKGVFCSLDLWEDVD